MQSHCLCATVMLYINNNITTANDNMGRVTFVTLNLISGISLLIPVKTSIFTFSKSLETCIFIALMKLLEKVCMH